MTSPARFFTTTLAAGIILIAVLAVIGFGLGAVQRGGEWITPDGVTFYAYWPDGTKREIEPGMMIAEGIALPDGSCEVPAVSVGSEGSRRGSSSISTSSDSDCNVWVDRIEWSDADR